MQKGTLVLEGFDQIIHKLKKKKIKLRKNYLRKKKLSIINQYDSSVIFSQMNQTYYSFPKHLYQIIS